MRAAADAAAGAQSPRHVRRGTESPFLKPSARRVPCSSRQKEGLNALTAPERGTRRGSTSALYSNPHLSKRRAQKRDLSAAATAGGPSRRQRPSWREGRVGPKPQSGRPSDAPCAQMGDLSIAFAQIRICALGAGRGSGAPSERGSGAVRATSGRRLSAAETPACATQARGASTPHPNALHASVANSPMETAWAKWPSRATKKELPWHPSRRPLPPPRPLRSSDP